MRDSLKRAYAKFARFYQCVGIERGHFHAQYGFISTFIKEYTISGNVLDAACGTGDVLNMLVPEYQAITFWGADGSLDLLSLALKCSNIKQERLRLSIWPSLSIAQFSVDMDFVFLLGNSIAHCDSEKELVNTIRAIFLLLKVGGYFCFDVRDWVKNVDSFSFNEPNLKPEIKIRVNGEEYLYSTQYCFENHRHNLIHNITPRENRGARTVINLSFLDLQRTDIVRLLENAGFKLLKIISPSDAYPYIGYIVQK